MSITREDVDQAAARIGRHVRRTPVAVVEADAFGTPTSLTLKLELMQHTGSFKARGAFNRVLSARERGELSDVGVVAASGGNAGLAVAYAAASVGVPAEVFVPATAPAVKVARLAALGATVRQEGREYAEAYEAARARADVSGGLFCHAYDQPEICAGQGTLALELAEQAPDVDTVLVAVGGGGLMAGVAAALEGRARVVGVEPESIPTLHQALAAGRPVDVEVSGVAADSLGARRLGDIGFGVAARCEVPGVLVSEAAIVAARRQLWQQCRLVVEHGAATALAALLQGAYAPEPGESVAVILCGANTDPSDLAG